ncbi:MAG TPA: hypothetical protein VGE34_03925 [Candidatus Saccharimonadales bacterium]
MKIRRSDNKKKKLLLVLLALLLTLAIGVVTYSYLEKIWFFAPSDSKAPTSQSDTPTTTAPDSPQEENSNLKDKEDLATSEKDKGSPVKNGSNPSKITAVAITLNTRQETHDTVTVSTKLQGISSGNCALSITNNRRHHSETAQVLYQPEFSTCAGFSVNRDVLGAGSWNIKLVVTSNGKTYTKESTLNVH